MRKVKATAKLSVAAQLPASKERACDLYLFRSLVEQQLAAAVATGAAAGQLAVCSRYFFG
jgi:hypothetical protein